MNPLYEHMYEGLISLLPIRYFTRRSVCLFVPSHLVFMMLMRSCCEKGWVTHSIKVDLKKKQKKLQLHFIWFSEKSPLSSRSLHLELSFYTLTPLKALQEWSFWFGSSLLKDKKKKTFSCWLLSLLSVRLAGYWHSLSKYFFWPQ